MNARSKKCLVTILVWTLLAGAMAGAGAQESPGLPEGMLLGDESGELLKLQTLATADFDHALEVYDRGDYDLAFIEFSALAEEGHAKSQFNLGLMYFRGLGTPANPGQSIYWALKSANQGYALAQYTVGAMYSSGHGLGRDADEAAKWFRRAADQNHAQAQHDLGSLYGEGRGVPRDAVIGRMWYLLAIPGLKGEAKSYATENLRTLERRMTAEETEQSDQLAADWKPRAVQN